MNTTLSRLDIQRVYACERRGLRLNFIKKSDIPLENAIKNILEKYEDSDIISLKTILLTLL